jgi:hypothetical protein
VTPCCESRVGNGRARGSVPRDESKFLTPTSSPFSEAGSFRQAQEKGLVRSEGKEYKVKDGDVLHFLHS